MQLTRVGKIAVLLCACLAAHREVSAQSTLAAGSSVFREAGGPVYMTVLVPEVSAELNLGEGLAVNAGWTADVVSGASVAVVDAPAADVDAISGATLSDVRHVFGGGLRVGDGQTTLAAGYHYGFENDYRSHAFDVSAKTELYERNTALEITYARAFDSVCDGLDASEAVLKARLDSSDGCFQDSAEDRENRGLDVHTFQGAWTQNWTSTLSMQATATASLLSGFQANPYRAILIGRSAAQEHHPTDRARYALGVGARVFIAPLTGALQPHIRAYRDTWDLRSLSAELGYEQTLGSGLRAKVRGRYYVQSGAAFYSDDYTFDPRGQYFTGDRELSPMESALLGAQIAWTVPTNQEGEVLGFLGGLTLAIKGDVLKSWFSDFHYDRAEVPNDLALLGALGLLASF